MKGTFESVAIVLIVLCIIFPAAAATEAPATAEAELNVPRTVMMERSLAAEVVVKWGGPAPIVFDTWTWSAEGRQHTFGQLYLYDDRGREVPMVWPMSMPLAPNGKVEIKPGETVSFGLYYLGSHQIPAPGRYSARATFTGITGREKVIRFETRRKWFEVIPAPPNKS